MCCFERLPYSKNYFLFCVVTQQNSKPKSFAKASQTILFVSELFAEKRCSLALPVPRLYVVCVNGTRKLSDMLSVHQAVLARSYASVAPKKPVRVAVTGAAGAIAYSLLFRIAQCVHVRRVWVSVCLTVRLCVAVTCWARISLSSSTASICRSPSRR
jgi:hypothetical protein